ncbi:PD-(D/E)XK nuclease family protein [Schleiferia thermophila]
MSKATDYDKDLIDFLLLEIPEPKQRQDGFMDIVGVQYHENTITQIYSYFLNRERSPDISDLFLESIIDLVMIKTNRTERLEFDNLFCSLEYQTNKGNQIDLVIASTSEGENGKQISKSALIIENKIFSGVHNDLHDYYDSVDATNKVGILLTLRRHNIPNDLQNKFINITHSEWMLQIKSRGLPTNLTYNNYVYLNDFINNMENLTDSNAMNTDAKFFFQYPSKVLRAKQTHDAAYNYIVSQLRIVAEKLGWSFYGNSWSWRHFWDSKNQAQVYFAIVLDKAVSEQPELTIFLEIYKDALKRETEFRQLLNENDFYKLLDDDKKSNSSWAHLAYKSYRLQLNDLERLSDYLYDKLQEDFMPAYNLLTNNLSSSTTNDN